MEKKITCPNCLKKIDEWTVYCSFCGEIVNKEKNASQQYQPQSHQSDFNNESQEPSHFEIKEITIKKIDGTKRKWWKPIKRKRSWYHPLEWLFWIGWSLYVVVRFLLMEFFRYLKWCICWGKPDELKEK